MRPTVLIPEFLLPRILKRRIQSLHGRGPERYSDSGPSILGASQAAALERKAKSLPLRTGALAIKKGMTAVYDPETGTRTPCTVVQLDRVQVVSHKTVKEHGYYAVQVGCGWKHPSNVTRPQLGHFTKHKVSPKRHVAEFRVKDERGLLKIGEIITPSWFQVGQYVDARADCKGKGFAGGMKRHGFKGQPASHGVSLTHRAMGSAGQSQGGGSRVYPGKKMAGRMGGQRVTVQNVEILSTDEEKGIVVLRGCIAGPKKGIVNIQDAIKKPFPAPPTIDLPATEISATSAATP